MEQPNVPGAAARVMAEIRHLEDPRVDELLTLTKRLLAMSETQASSNAALTASVAKLASDFSAFASNLTTGLEGLKAQIAAGATPDFTAVDAATTEINAIDAALATASSNLAAAVGDTGNVAA